MRNILIFLSVVILLSGCGSHQTKHLRASSQGGFFALDSPQVFSIAGNLGTKYYIFLAAGAYQAAHESDEGVFYVGPAHALRIENGEMKAVAEGGIYLPHVLSEPAMTWIYSNSLQRFQRGSKEPIVIAEIDQSMLGDVELQWDIPERLKESIQVVQ